VTHTLFDYERLAVKLARDPQRLSELRARIAQARDNSPLFDSATFTRDLEGLYTKLVRGG
jgi:predicted O-linked N-acetylglucosamine transferase (SPINDLY family)